MGNMKQIYGHFTSALRGRVLLCAFFVLGVMVSLFIIGKSMVYVLPVIGFSVLFCGYFACTLRGRLVLGFLFLLSALISLFLTNKNMAYMLPILVFSVFFAWAIGQGISARLQPMLDVIHKVRSGARQARVKIEGTDTAMIIADEFNNMLDSLEKRDKELESAAEKYRLVADNAKKAELEARNMCERIDVVNKIGALVTGSLKLEDVLTRILDGILNACKASVGMIFIRDPETGCLYWGASRGLSEKFVNEYMDSVIKPEEGLTGRIAETGEVIYIPEDVSHNPQIARGVIVDEGLNSFIGVPIYAEGQVVAVMNILTRPPDVLTTEILPLLQAVAAYVGPAIRNARLFSEREFLSSAINQSSEAVVLTDLDTRINYVNPAFEQITGYSQHEVMMRKINILKSGSHDAAFYEKLWGNLSRGESWHGSFVNRRKDGCCYEEDCVIFPVRNFSGEVVGYAAIKRDVTREHELESQIQQVQKIDAIGRLAGGVAHDFNNILQAIAGFCEIGLKDAPLKSSQHEVFLDIQKSAWRAAALTQQLLSFSRQHIITPVTIDFNKVVTDIRKMLARLIGEDIQIILDLEPELKSIKADLGQLDQVIMNLAINARDAMPDGGKIIIKTSFRSFAENDISDDSEARVGDFICLTFSDTGVGMSKKVMIHIFEPFFTTKERGKGTGLGLSVVYGIIKKHNGWINASSEVGVGTSFSIYLPVCKETTPAVGKSVVADKALAEAQNARILVVEDEAIVRKIAVKMLKTGGFTVESAASGEEALKLFDDNGGSFDLVFSDIVMPGMSGMELIKILKKKKPVLPTLLCSGYSDDRIQLEDIEKGGVYFLQKPYQYDNLLKTIHGILDYHS